MTTDSSHTTGNGFSRDAFNHRDSDTLYGDNPARATSTPATSTTSSHAIDGAANENFRMGPLGLELSYLPPDQRPAHITSNMLHQFDVEIEDDTEAAEALRANANIKVSKVGKIARSINAQTVRHMAKRATFRNKSGNARAKPPRIPPGQIDSQDPSSEIYPVEEGDEEYVDDDSYGYDMPSDGSHQEPHRLPERMPHDDDEDDASPPTDTKKVAFSQEHQKPTQQQDVNGYVPPQAAKPPATGTTAAVAPFDDEKAFKRPLPQNEDCKDIPADVYDATVEAGKKFLGAVDTHNLLTLQRWRKKKKSSEKKDRKSYVKGKVIDGKHELYALSIAVMLGVRTSIAKTNSAITAADGRRTLTPQDFMTEEKYEFAPKGSATTPPHKLSHTFKFKDYAPMAFAYIRRMFGVNEFDFLLSVCGNANFIEFISNAKSGQFFFYSSDGKYMIKTMTNAESKFLRRILPHYFKHCTQNPNTLLPKFYGMYRVKLYHLRRNVKFVVMNSVYYTDKYLQTFYDLKGSVLGREAKSGQDVLKDNDLRAKLPQEPLAMYSDVRERLRAQIVSDCRFLQSMQIMDYSLLVGIHHIPPKRNAAPGSIAKTGFRIKNQQRRSSRTTDLNGAVGCAKNHDFPDDSSGASSQMSDLKADQLKSEPRLSDSQSDSTKKLILDFRDSTMTTSTMNDAIVGALDDEDDNSYLDDADASNGNTQQRAGRVNHGIPASQIDDIEYKKEHTIEQIYWPFHRFFDINGYRRMKQKACYRCKSEHCTCESNSQAFQAWNIPEFVPPLSNRKDGGFMMDTTGLQKPMHFKTPNGDRPYVGKIFYMGIIDILQQYNVRKRVETRYRKVEGYEEPSCVHPVDYADRFIRFFDEFSQPCAPATPGNAADGNEKTEIELSTTGNQDVRVSIQNGH